MKKVKKWRYYCEFCKKSGASGGHMQKHETGCTNNPRRICQFCKLNELEQKDATVLAANLKALAVKDVDAAMKALRTECGDCPTCILSAIRQSGLLGYKEEGYIDFGFDYQKEKEQFWISHNQREPHHV